MGYSKNCILVNDIYVRQGKLLLKLVTGYDPGNGRFRPDLE